MAVLALSTAALSSASFSSMAATRFGNAATSSVSRVISRSTFSSSMSFSKSEFMRHDGRVFLILTCGNMLLRQRFRQLNRFFYRLQRAAAMLRVGGYGGGNFKISFRRAHCCFPPSPGHQDDGARARARCLLSPSRHLSSPTPKRRRGPKPLLRNRDFHLPAGSGKDLADLVAGSPWIAIIARNAKNCHELREIS